MRLGKGDNGRFREGMGTWHFWPVRRAEATGSLAKSKARKAVGKGGDGPGELSSFVGVVLAPTRFVQHLVIGIH
jgi:hypothetical protein